jgi:hypothetical protein
MAGFEVTRNGRFWVTAEARLFLVEIPGTPANPGSASILSLSKSFQATTPPESKKASFHRPVGFLRRARGCEEIQEKIGGADKSIGRDVSIVYHDVSSELANTQGMLSLYRQEIKVGKADPPFGGQTDQFRPKRTFAVTHAAYAQQVVLRFTSNIDGAMPELLSACYPAAEMRVNGAGRQEVSAIASVQKLVGARVGEFVKGQIVDLTPIQLAVFLLKDRRLPSPSHRVSGLKANTDTLGRPPDLVAVLGKADDRDLRDNLTAFEYCKQSGTCRGLITEPRQFLSSGKAYFAESHGCVVGTANPSKWDRVRLLGQRIWLRDVKLRELAIFLSDPPPEDTSLGVSDYTSHHLIKTAQPSTSGTFRAPDQFTGWIYEYSCVGGVATLYPFTLPLTTLTVRDHLRAWRIGIQ